MMRKGGMWLQLILSHPRAFMTPHTVQRFSRQNSITLEYNDYYGEAVQEEMKKLIPEYLSIVRAAERKLHYLTA